MTEAQGRIVVTSSVQRIVTVTQGGRVVEVRQALSPHIQVISMGVQGPVGTVAESVLNRAAIAEATAEDAKTLAEGAATDLASLTRQLRDAFTYHTGVISSQE